MHKKFLFPVILSSTILAGFANAAPLADGATKFLGNITTNGAVRSDFGTYWNQITAENECKWGSIEGTRGTYNFRGCKAAYDWAKNNGGHFKFHALVWGSQYPSWLENLSIDDTKKAITAWFDAVAKEFPDLEMIDVVNEAIRTGTNQYHSGYPKTKIIQALGGDNNDYAFITTAFRMARERWPKAILIYNDYNTFRWQINEGIALVNQIKAAGAPVDAYGQQAHDLTDMDATSFKAALKKIHEGVGIPLFITEYDIGTDDDALQLQRYKEQIPEFWNAEYVAGVTLWGYIYGSTWTTNGNSGIIKNGSDRPAMTWLKEYMASNKGVNTTGLLGSTSTPDTVPQAPYTDTIAIPGIVEAENYDVGGQNKSYYDATSENEGNADFRTTESVDIVNGNSGKAIGYTVAGEWLEYTVKVGSAGIYTYEASVASGSDGSSFRLFIDDQAITDTVKLTKGADWDTYSTISGQTTALTAGSHILKIAITGDYTNIDNIKFTEGITKLAEIKANLVQGSQGFKVYNIKGTYLSSFQANSFSELKTQMQSSSLKSGVYLVRNKNMNKFIEVKR
ncbi:MAG: endo-1,4-beta-xylanase [Fibrobacteraceae bacterium]|nr:endo-1,4-beta-xylanase [Fibrobacteraceae bacterium]